MILLISKRSSQRDFSVDKAPRYNNTGLRKPPTLFQYTLNALALGKLP